MKTALLCVSFGTSVPSARESITAVENALREEAPQADFFRAFTSPTIRRLLLRCGETVKSPKEALKKLAPLGYDHVILQPTHLLYGIEYDNLRACAQECEPLFPRLTFGLPLLAGSGELCGLAHILETEYPPEDGLAFVFMGHGTPHFSNLVYPALQAVFHMDGRKECFVGTVEGWPDLPTVVKELHESRFSRVRLVPLMLVAGDHALHDMDGDDPESWTSTLTREGFSVDCVMQGLGMLRGVQDLYRRHLRALL